MGVSGLYTFMQKKRLCEEIDMRDEIQKFRRLPRKPREQRERHIQKRPTIIFDILSPVHLFLGGTPGMLGGQHDKSLKIIKKFFEELIAVGAVLIFFFDGQIQKDKENEWCGRSEGRYKTSINFMKQGKATKNDQFKCNAFFQRVLRLIKDKKFGEIRVSRKVDNDLAIAKYASDCTNEVLAVVSNDTDMLIFDGNFQVWNIDSIDSIERCKALHLDRKKLLDYLDLSRDQMKICATIKGNDFTKRFIYEKLCCKMNLRNWENLSGITKKIPNGELKEKCKEIAKAMLKPGVDDRLLIQSVEKSLQFYNLDFEFHELSDESSREINLLKYCFEEGYPFQYDVQFIDFKSNFINILLEAFQRIGGILQHEQPSNTHLNELKIITKPDEKQKYQRIKLSPICRNNDRNESDVKWKNLLFSLGLQLDTDYLKKITQTKDDIIMTILAVLFLLKGNQITERQSDLLLLMHCKILMKKVSLSSLEKLPKPHICQYETIRTAQAFHKTFTLVDDFFYICGLKEHAHEIPHDGVYYNYLMTELPEGREKHTQKQLIECLGGEIKTIYDWFKEIVMN